MHVEKQSMTLLDDTLASLAPGVTHNTDLDERYNPKHGLAIYCLPVPGYSPSSPGVVLGEAMAARSGLGCTLLEGVPGNVPEGAVVLGQYSALKALRPDLLADVPELSEQGQYAVRIGRHCVVTSPSREGLSSGMQTLAMLILRHNESTLPGSLIVDTPFCHVRALAVEVATGEIGAGLLTQITSFAATFKANRLHLILDNDFDPSRSLAGLDAFVHTCQSYGIGVGVRLPWLARLASGQMTLLEAWTGIRSAARLFGAGQAALDDPCPMGIPADRCRRIAASILNGDVGLQNFSVDARLLAAAGCAAGDLRAVGAAGWHRLWKSSAPPGQDISGLPLQIDVQSAIPGFSNRTAAGYHHRLNAAVKWLRAQERRELIVSFRNVGVSHLWQNMLFPAATGLIAGWGQPGEAESAAARFANLLYGDAAGAVMEMWNSVSRVFPPGLSSREEALVRKTAFGRWPATAEEVKILTGVDWLAMAGKIRSAAEALKSAGSGLSRNASTLAGARLALYAMSWLHCFLALAPELERRRDGEAATDDERTPAIAAELMNNFRNWQLHLRELASESGLEVAELDVLEEMEERLATLCEGVI